MIMCIIHIAPTKIETSGRPKEKLNTQKRPKKDGIFSKQIGAFFRSNL